MKILWDFLYAEEKIQCYKITRFHDMIIKKSDIRQQIWQKSKQ